MLRVTEPTDQEISNLVAYFGQKGLGYVVAKEVGKETEKPHIHAVLQPVENIQTLRVAIGRCLETKGNKKYSLKALHDLQGALRYVCKDGNIIHHNWIWDKSPEEYKQSYWTCHDEIQNERKRRSRKSHWLEDLAKEIRTSQEPYTTYDLHRKLCERSPSPTHFALIANMAKLRRLLDLEGFIESSWIHLCDKYN